MAGLRTKWRHLWRDKKGDDQARSKTALVASSTRGSNSTQQERSEGSLASLVNHQELPAAQSLWDRAYDALAKKKTELVKKYETLLAEEEQMANSASNDKPPAQSIPPPDATCGPDGPSRQAQLNTVIQQGLRRMEETKATYNIAGHEFVLTDQITQAAKLLLWAKSWIGEAVKASPQASVAWAGVCLILPLLTNLTTAAEASLDGFTDVTTRMRYYVALEPLLRRLGQNAGVSLMSEAEDHIVDLYQHILDFQICCVLRFYQSRLKTYAHDVFSTKDWKQTALDIKAREETVSKDLRQMNELVARQELEALNKTSIDALEIITGLLSVSVQQLDVSIQQLGVLQEIQQDGRRQKLSDEHERCLQLFYYTENKNEAPYDWYKDRVENSIQGTCQWFLQHDHFKSWLAQESGPLLVSADPGCGKSVLAKHLIDHVLKQPASTICYFFFKDQDQNTARQALCALLHQLFSQKPTLIQHAIELYRSMGQGLLKSTASLWTILRNAVRDPQAGSVIIVVDALDECAESDFKDLLKNVENLFSRSQSANTKLKILFTSRPYEQILYEFSSLIAAFPHIRIPGEEESERISQEVNHVIRYRVEQLATKRQLSDKVKSALEKKLLGTDHRTYLWIYLVFDFLDTGFIKTVKGVEAAIQTLPQSVNQAYERILNRSNKIQMVKKVLSVVLVASRPLTVSEMNIALKIEVSQGQSFRDIELEDEGDFKSRIRTECGLFISIHHNRVYFLHQTAREFLTKASSTAASSNLRWHHSITTRQAHTLLAEICVFYLNMYNSEEKGVISHDNDCDAFLDYSANNWGIHFHEAEIKNYPVMVSLAETLCDSRSTSHSIWTSIWCINMIEYRPEYFTGLLVASRFGLDCVVEQLLYNDADVEAKDNYGETPLLWAAFKGHETVARLLLDKGADIEAKDIYGQTPLLIATSSGHDATARLLLDKGADIEAKDNEGKTSLSLAAYKGYEAVARLLLDKGADIEAKNNDGETPLILAAFEGHEAVARLLLDKGADIKAKDNNGQTSLLKAAYKGYEAVARLLLDKGADIKAKNNDGETPLILAAFEGHEAVARLLLDKGADIEAKNNDGETPLILAAFEGHEAVARLLLDKGADIKAKDNNGQTSLLKAVLSRYEAVARLLLDKGADIEAKNNDGETPLILAAFEGHEAVARLLLDKGADIEAKNNDGETPLILAAFVGHEAVARLLLDKGADIKAKDNDDQTPLLKAALFDYEVVARLLFGEGADIKAKDDDGRTSLLLTAFKGHEAVARLLLDKGADIEAKDNDGQTPLLKAVLSRYEAVARLLLDKGADIKAKDNDGRTSLLLAAERGNEAVTQLLLDKGADIEAKDNNGRTPLLKAAFIGHEAVARLLLDKGADIKAKDNDDQTPLSLAAERGNEDVIKLLKSFGARSL